MGLIRLEPLMKNRQEGRAPLSPAAIHRATKRKNSGYRQALDNGETYVGVGCRLNAKHIRTDGRTRRFEHTGECLLCVAADRPGLHAEIHRALDRRTYTMLRVTTAREAIRRRHAGRDNGGE